MNNIDVKINTAHEIGCRLDDMLDNNTKDLYRASGAIEAFKQALTLLEDIPKFIDKDLDDGKFELDVASIAKSYVARAQSAIRNMLSSSETNRMLMQGRINAMSQAVKMVKDFSDTEKRRDEAMKSAYEKALERAKEEVTSSTQDQLNAQRKPGDRPSSSLKMKRIAESLPKDSIESDVIVTEGEQIEQEAAKTQNRSKKEKK